MPGIYYQPFDRRTFLSSTAKALGAVALANAWGWVETIAAPSAGPLRLALFSDLHVAADPKSENRKFLPWENLKRVVAQAQEVHPWATLINGDLARATGEVVDYEAVKSLLEPLAQQGPIYLALGNHDHRENFFKQFHPPEGMAQRVAAKHVLVIEQPAMRFIVLDSLLYVNKSEGLLGKAQREWLDKYLAGSDARTTIVFVHHTLGDGDGELLDAEALLRIIRPYAKVKAVFYGHSHEYSYRQHQGIHLINLPAVGYNFSDKQPVGWVDGVFSPEGVELTLRAIGGERAQDGQTKRLTWREG